MGQNVWQIYGAEHGVKIRVMYGVIYGVKNYGVEYGVPTNMGETWGNTAYMGTKDVYES